MSKETRLHRGFHRVGVVLAAPVLLLAVGLAGHEAWAHWTTKDPWAAFPIVEPARPAATTSQAPSLPDAGPDDWVRPDEVLAPGMRPAGNYVPALALAAAALALYAAARAVGWVLAGLLSPSR